MKAKKFGRILNIASAHGLFASEYKSAYVAAKHGVLGLTKVTALEGAPFNINCNAICPGYVRTPLVDAQIRDQAKSHDISGRHFYEENIHQMKMFRFRIRSHPTCHPSKTRCEEVCAGRINW